MGVGAHPPATDGRELPELGHEAAALVEQLLGPVAAEPLLELPEVLRVVAHLRERHLVGAPRPLHRPPVDLLRAGPPLRRPQDEHRPPRTLDRILGPGSRADLGDPVERLVERDGKSPMHVRRILPVEATGDEQRLPAVALEQSHELALRDPGKDRRARDLVAVQVQDREHGAVGARIEELVRMPARRQRTGLRLPVADDADDDQVGIVEGRAERVDERIAELAAFMDRAGRLRGRVARDAARKRELAEQPA